METDVFFQILKFILVYFILISVIPSGKLLLLYLESSYPNKINLPDQIDGILVLSGHENLELSNEYDQLYLGGSTNRLIESVRLGNKYPKAKIVFSASALFSGRAKAGRNGPGWVATAKFGSKMK